jgi:ABC-2 type transport system permease protein
MVGLLGGMFSYLAWTLRPVIRIGLGWFYFSLLSGLAAFLGIFGSVFNTNAGLYLAKDNDLLLSMPIPVNDIIIARLASVYLMG